MSKFAIVVLLPEDKLSPERMDFMSKEFATVEDMVESVRELEVNIPDWRLLTFCHVEDLPLVMEGP